MTRILIAEGEPLIASFVQRGLRANGYATRIAEDPRTALELAASGEFELLIVDARLLGPEEMRALVQSRAGGPAMPMVILESGSPTPPDGLPGFEPAERLTKPFKFRELLSSVRLLLHREGIGEPSVLRAGRSTLDLEAHKLTVGDECHELSENEFGLAEAMFRNAGRDLTFDELVGEVSRPLNGHGTSSVEADFRRLREKLGSELVTIVGLVGYRLRGNGDG